MFSNSKPTKTSFRRYLPMTDNRQTKPITLPLVHVCGVIIYAYVPSQECSGNLSLDYHAVSFYNMPTQKLLLIRDLAIFVTMTDNRQTKPIALPLVHVCGVIMYAYVPSQECSGSLSLDYQCHFTTCQHKSCYYAKAVLSSVSWAKILSMDF